MKMLLIGLTILLLATSGFCGTKKSDYSIIVNKNLFSPSRTYNKKESSRKEIPINAVLYGTAILKNLKRAFIEEKNEKGVFERKEVRVGDEICGYKIKDILPGCIILASENSKTYNLTFETNKERRRRSSTFKMAKRSYATEKTEIEKTKRERTYTSRPSLRETVSESKKVSRPAQKTKTKKPKALKRKVETSHPMSAAEEAKLRGVMKKFLPTNLSSEQREKVIRRIMEIHKGQKLALPGK